MSGNDMRTQSINTRLEAEETPISLFKKASAAKKFSQIRSLSQATRQLPRRAIARANKKLSEWHIDILFVSYHTDVNTKMFLPNMRILFSTTITSSEEIIVD